MSVLTGFAPIGVSAGQSAANAVKKSVSSGFSLSSLAGGIPGFSSGPATSGNGDSIFNNDSKLGGLNYNKGLPNWAAYVALGVGAWAVWRVSR